MPKNSKITIISGPTASGKSGLALVMAKKHNGVVINADSMQIYQGLPILSAQPNAEEQAEVPHLLYSVIPPQQNCSLGIWLDLAVKAINETLEAGKQPFVVGGTGMYIQRLIEGVSPIPNISEEIRKEAMDLYQNIGSNELHKRIQEHDPIAATKIKPTDKQRLIRAYEVWKQTGKTFSEWQNVPHKKFYKTEDFEHISLNPDREELYKKCNLRFVRMINDGGAVDEVKELMKLNLSDDCTITKTLGYYEIRDYIKGLMTYDEMVRIATQKTRNYAKRQNTWFRHQFTLLW